MPTAVLSQVGQATSSIISAGRARQAWQPPRNLNQADTHPRRGYSTLLVASIHSLPFSGVASSRKNGRETTVDIELGARDEARLVAGDKNDEACDFLG